MVIAITTSISRHFHFNRVVLLCNLFPMIDLNQSFSSVRRIVLAHLLNHACISTSPLMVHNFVTKVIFVRVLNILIVQEHMGLVFRLCTFVHPYVKLVLVLTLAACTPVWLQSISIFNTNLLIFISSRSCPEML